MATRVFNLIKGRLSPEFHDDIGVESFQGLIGKSDTDKNPSEEVMMTLGKMEEEGLMKY